MAAAAAATIPRWLRGLRENVEIISIKKKIVGFLRCSDFVQSNN